MKFVALVSGGKDSCMNILYAQKQGHELVACANLHPKPSRPEEIDSFMFQTVGSGCLANLSECLDVPLYTRELDEDNKSHEIDDVVEVLKQVLAHHPDIKGVSVGAIGSVYQQVRVDSACSILGLVSLCYLWQREQSELLQDIIDSGMESRMIKVAGYGLNETHLGKTLAELQPTLMALHSKWGLYPCGEGGEFETMVFDGPQFKKRMAMLNPEIIKHSNGDVYYLKFETQVEEKPQQQLSSLLEPAVWDSFWDELEMLPHINWKEQGNYKLSPQTKFCETFKGSQDQVFSNLEAFYQRVPVQQTIHVCVLLDDMSKFAVLNDRYNKIFSFESPPSRKCIATNISHEVQITIYGGEVDWEGKCIHVQGRSYWAPANIGPYSQSKLYFGVNYMAGQIGLLPTTLELGPEQVKLSLQNAIRIVNTVHGPDNWLPLTAVVYISDPQTRAAVESIWPFNIPLVVAEVEALPRGAQAEWDISTVDLKYINGHPPQEDEIEEWYFYSPHYVRQGTGYTCYYGSSKVSVGLDPRKFSTKEFSTTLSTNGGTIPVKALYMDGFAVDSVTISLE